MVWAKKVKAGALQLVLFVSVVVAVLLLCFVLLAHTHNLFRKKTNLMVEVIQAADSGLEHSFEMEFDAGEPLDIPVANEVGISVEVQRKYWGLLELRTAIATKGKLKFEKSALVGNSILKRNALFLQDKQRPMVIAGNAQIRGDAYLPERGIKPGNIKGHGYYGPQLVYGNQKQSKAQLPELSRDLQGQLKQLSTIISAPFGEEVALGKEMVLKNSFRNPLKIIKGGEIRLQNIHLAGHVMVWATQNIVVDATAILKDVVLMAPKIEIRKGFQGSLQAFATKAIEIGEGCYLAYPSVLLVDERHVGSEQRNPAISIAAQTDFRGFMIYQNGESDEHRSRAHIKIAKNAQVMGEVYCQENLELKGSVKGTVTTGAFIALENGSSYQNHLFNGIINSTQLPPEYAGLTYEGQKANQVMKWLY
ncbi:MAG: hypothetical protein CMH48_09975 [Muricauda sp.]|nr:hypothetical protein [Allomuricauda sp.]MAU27264.1 hypothetical protein [Allomuricauda sp.]MBC31161.1 hypothetical protein [Allomuricauda sp.]|tara:strand:- start:67 stop:1326 length:1260 start_codon:yes stop_codon:yes gene_type:complete